MTAFLAELIQPAFVIEAETPRDVSAREALLDRAMGPGRRRKSSEKIRRGRLPAEGLAFVARDADGRVVGTVRLWDVGFDVCAGTPPPSIPPHKGEGDTRVAPSNAASEPGAEGAESASPLWGGVRGGGIATAPRPANRADARALLLGPLAVDPALKSAGVGSALMRHAVAEAARLGHCAVLLVGDAPYYARFGFSADKTGALAMPGPYELERFLALELRAGALDGARGVLRATGRKVEQAARRMAA